MSLFGRVLHNWGSRVLIYMLSLSLKGAVITEKVFLGTELCCLGRRVTWVKLNCSSYPLQYIQTHIYFLSRWYAGTSSLDSWASTKILLSMSSRPWPIGNGVSSWDTTWSTDGIGFCMPITQCTGGWYFSRVSWHMVLDPTVPTKAFLTVDRCQIVEGVYEWRTSYSAICWHIEPSFWTSGQSPSWYTHSALPPLVQLPQRRLLNKTWYTVYRVIFVWGPPFCFQSER